MQNSEICCVLISQSSYDSSNSLKLNVNSSVVVFCCVLISQSGYDSSNSLQQSLKLFGCCFSVVVKL